MLPFKGEGHSQMSATFFMMSMLISNMKNVSTIVELKLYFIDLYSCMKVSFNFLIGMNSYCFDYLRVLLYLLVDSRIRLKYFIFELSNSNS